MLWSTFEKRGFLRSVRSQAVKANQGLEAALLGVVEGRFLSITQGRVLVSFSNDSGASGWQAPGGKNQVNVMELASELMDRLDQAEEALAAAGNPNPNEDLVFDAMMTGLRAIKGYTFNTMYMSK